MVIRTRATRWKWSGLPDGQPAPEVDPVNGAASVPGEESASALGEPIDHDEAVAVQQPDRDRLRLWRVLAEPVLLLGVHVRRGHQAVALDRDDKRPAGGAVRARVRRQL